MARGLLRLMLDMMQRCSQGISGLGATQHRLLGTDMNVLLCRSLDSWVESHRTVVGREVSCHLAVVVLVCQLCPPAEPEDNGPKRSLQPKLGKILSTRPTIQCFITVRGITNLDVSSFALKTTSP